MATFLDELTRLNAGNFMGGLADIGSAIKQIDDNITLTQKFKEFKSKRSQLEGTDAKTTDGVVSEFKKEIAELSGLNEQKDQDFLDKLPNVAMAAVKATRAMGAYANLYQPYIASLATLGEDGVRLAATLEKELDTKIKGIEKEAGIPAMMVELRAKKLDFIKAIKDIDIKNYEHAERIKKDLQEQTNLDLLTDMMRDEEVQYFMNVGSGVIRPSTVATDDPKLKSVVSSIYNRFKARDGFSTVMTALLSKFKPEFRNIIIGSTVGADTDLNPEEKTVIANFSTLEAYTNFKNEFDTSPEPIYVIARKIVYGNYNADAEADADSTVVELAKEYAKKYYRIFRDTIGNDSYKKIYARLKGLIESSSNAKFDNYWVYKNKENNSIVFDGAKIFHVKDDGNYISPANSNTRSNSTSNSADSTAVQNNNPFIKK